MIFTAQNDEKKVTNSALTLQVHLQNIDLHYYDL